MTYLHSFPLLPISIGCGTGLELRLELNYLTNANANAKGVRPRARLLTVSFKKSSAWLKAIPVSSWFL